MSKKEKLQPNRVNAPIIFIGEGGIGSKIIKGVADRCVRDDTSNVRFVVLDTDANDLISVNKGAEIIPIQTSSTSTVEHYLKNDPEAKNTWFPENKMMDSKSVSEGAGQVRAISRLAINDVIKSGAIQKLYKAIDDLFLKDGGGFKQAIRVVIASTVAGGTGSGIAMETGMLVRHYVQKNYPQSAVMIRGFLVMPGVMDTVIESQSERNSLRCNGYATIKEINAFMMKGSGFFDTVPELNRYKDLHLTVPNASAGDENISGLPFDFCFLMDRTDSNAGNMTTLPQYIDYAAQSIYEQNIGPMHTKASSVEDNILKLCINPEKMGRCRFAGAGSSILEYPRDDIRDYVALNWTRAAIIGSSSDERLSEKERKELLEQSWLQFDTKYRTEHKQWEENPSSSGKNEPTLHGVYISTVEAGRDPKNGNDFAAMLWDKFLNDKIECLGNSESERTIGKVSEKYINTLADGVINGPLEMEYGFASNGTFREAKAKAERKSYANRYDTIQSIESEASSSKFSDIIRAFAKEVFNSKASADKEDLGEYMLEKFLSTRGKVMHPNAVRYLLYKLCDVIDAKLIEADREIADFQIQKDRIIFPTDGNEKEFEAVLHRGSEESLQELCEACDKLNNLDNAVDSSGERCNNKMDKYFTNVEAYFHNIVVKNICEIARPVVSNLLKSYENFYGTFTSKIPSIERKKEDIVTKLKFNNGDCVKYILGKKEYLDRLASSISRPSESGEEASKLYAKIFESVRNNAYIEARRNVNPFAHEGKKDIFDDIIIEYYKDRVDESCDIINVKSVLHAAKLEYEVKTSIELEGISEERQDVKAAELYRDSAVERYISDLIQICRNLASPGIKKKDNEETREVNLVDCSDVIEDGEGIRISTFIPNAIKSPNISRYRLCFYRAVYNIMPTQLAKLSAPEYNDGMDEFSNSADNEYEMPSAGDYFKIYQSYMDKIGPNSKTSAIITPHIDKRWNAISVMPELDMDYQKRLMRKIHKSMIYGFVYDRIRLYRTSDQNPDEKIYKYLGDRNDTIDLVVSNQTKCDVLYEVLDALYFDRLAVSTIRNYVNKIRVRNEDKGARSYETLEFFKGVRNLKFKRFVNNKALNSCDDAVSLFTIALMYCNSLPAQSKDLAELKIMVEAIIEMIRSEMKICAAGDDALSGAVGEIIVEQFNLLMDNYHKHIDVLRCGMFSEQVCEAIYNAISAYFEDNNMLSFNDKLNYSMD